MTATTIPGCATCTETGRRGTCAPLRCYCGHPTCHAFASFVPRRQPFANVHQLTTARPTSSAWDDREGSTWIDDM